jgi:carbonic anhydrase
MSFYEQVFENNKSWVEEKLNLDPEYFHKMAEGQSPEILYIGCSDSRVTAEKMTGIKPGEMFVHRNIANLVPNNDLSSASVIEYAVDHLEVKHIVVCGHYYCGGVKAAMEAQDLGLLNPWLRNIRDVYRTHNSELNAISDETERYKRLVELNVQEQCINVIKMACIQKSYLTKGSPIIHGWVFDIYSGKVIDLQIDFAAVLKDIQGIYDLGTQR